MSVYFYIGLTVLALALTVVGVIIAVGFGRVIHERDKQIPRKDDDQ